MVRIIILSIFALFFTLNVQAETQTTVTRVIVTPAPKPVEVVVTPTGYTKCDPVPAGWYGDVWVPAHQVCHYEKSTEGVAWVEGYWSCKAANANNDCTNWEWKSGHWVKTLDQMY